MKFSSSMALCLAALGAPLLIACDNVLGLHEITPDGEPFALLFTPATRVVAQQPLDRFTVTVVDVREHVVPGFTGEVTLTLGNNPGGATLLGAPTATVVNGSAYFDLVGIDKPGTGYTLAASAPGLPVATSAPINVIAPAFTPVPTGNPGGRITSVVVSPAPVAGTTSVFAGVADGVYKSVDGGANWKPSSFGADTSVRLVADLNRPGVVYHSHGGSAAPYFLKKTTDGGATWHELGAGDSLLRDTYYFALDPKNSSLIYTSGVPPHRSSDGGATWTTLGQINCNQITVDAVAVDTVYCVAYDSRGGQSLGLAKSVNGGAGWSPSNNGLDATNVGMLEATPKAVLVQSGGSVRRSTDAGGSWASVLSGYPTAIAYAPSMPDRIYIALGSAVAVSSDGGATFAAPVEVGDYVQDVAVDPTNPNLLYAAGFNEGMFLSSNGGATWSQSSKGIDVRPVISAAIPGAPGVALATIQGKVLRTTNGGMTWTTILSRQASIHIDPVVRTRVYLCGFNYFATSTDSGATFTGGNVTSMVGECARVVVAGTTFFAAANGLLLKSIDSGANWSDTGLGGGNGFYVNDVALGDAAGNVVVAAAGSGVFRSTNGGMSFTPIVNETSSSIIADPRSPANIVVNVEEGVCGYRRSTDGGATFSIVNPGPCAQRFGAAGSALYASGRSQDPASFNETILWTSADGGARWTPLEIAGVPRGAFITSIAASDDGATVYLGTQGGLFKGTGR